MTTEQGDSDGGSDVEWLDTEERGSNLGIRVLLWWTGRFGRRATRFPLQTTAAYYSLFGGEARSASLDYLRRVKGEAGIRDVYRNILSFAQCTLDRVYLLRGRADLFEVNSNGAEHLRRLKAEGRGAILIGAHLGSFEAGRVAGDWQDLPMNLLVHFENARRINAFFREVSPEFQTRLIEVHPGKLDHVFEVQAAIERGELVAISGDRIGLNEKFTTAPFLGAPARFPTGAYVLAAALECPVYLVFGLYHEPNRYELYCEPFADPVELPRKSRQEALDGYAREFAARLEHYCRLAPYDWFNFYDFWAE